MSTDKTKPKSQAARPLMPRLATYNVSSKPSPTLRLAAHATPPSTTRPRLATAKSMSNLVQPNTSTNTPMHSVRATTASITPRSTVRRPKLESTQSTPTASIARGPLVPLKQGSGAAINSRMKSVPGSRAVNEKNTPTRGPTLTKSGDFEGACSPQTSPITPRLSPSLEGIGKSFFLANDAMTIKATAKTGGPSKAVGFVRANGEEDEQVIRVTGPRVATVSASTLGKSTTTRPNSSNGVSIIAMTPQSAEPVQVRNRDMSASPTHDMEDQRWTPASRSGGLLTLEQHGVNTVPKFVAAISTSLQEASGYMRAVEHTFPSHAGLLPSPTFFNAESIENDRQEAISRLSINSQHGEAVDVPISPNKMARLDKEAQVVRSPESSVISLTKSQCSTASSEVIQSPPTSVSDIGGKAFEHAASARRDRKVLDLEISNSSLLAINSTLERELRRQKTELRRFRRLTRTNGLDCLAAEVVDGSFNSPRKVREDDSTDGESSIEGESEDEFSEDTSASSNDFAESSKRRNSDIKMLKLDLAKHREILVDGQKMNQSLGRCMGLTEQLIRDANKAISYRVRYSDMQLGGRVLAQEEEDNDHHNVVLHNEHDDTDDNVSLLHTRSPRRDYFDGAYELRVGPQPPQRVFSKPLSEVMREMF